MRQVGDLPVNRVQLGGQPVQFGLQLLDLFAQLAALVLPRLALGRVLGLADRLGDLVGLAVRLPRPGLAALARCSECDEVVHVNAERRDGRSSA